MIASGMLIGGEDIPVAYDRFRHRVIFPITDLRGRVIAFGGRALDPDQPAKYLNSPETPLFHKGHDPVQRAARARAGARQGARHRRRRLHGRHLARRGGLCRGRRAARHRADRRAGEAPVAHAPTSRCSASTATRPGRKAAFRAVETVLPLLKPGFTVRFAFLPGGLDPDDLVRQKRSAGLRRRAGQDAARCSMCCGSARSRIRICRRPSSAPPSRRASRRMVAKIGDAAVRDALRARAARDAVGPQSHAWCARSPAAKGRAGRRPARAAQQRHAGLARTRARPARVGAAAPSAASTALSASPRARQPHRAWPRRARPCSENRF